MSTEENQTTDFSILNLAVVPPEVVRRDLDGNYFINHKLIILVKQILETDAARENLGPWAQLRQCVHATSLQTMMHE